MEMLNLMKNINTPNRCWASSALSRGVNMSLSDCVKCWDTPCTCGHEYRHWTPDELKNQILMLQKILESKEKSKKKKD